MRTVVFFLLALICLAGNAQVNNDLPTVDQQYFPESFRKFYVNMPVSELLAMRKNVEMDGEKGTYVTYYDEVLKDEQFSEITYQADGYDNVYEYIFEFNKDITTEQILTYAKRMYGKPNAADESMPYQWKFKLDGLTLLIWIYNNRLCIADDDKMN